MLHFCWVLLALVSMGVQHSVSRLFLLSFFFIFFHKWTSDELQPINWIYWNWLFENRIYLLFSSIFAISSESCQIFLLFPHKSAKSISIEKSLVAHNFDKRQTPNWFQFHTMWILHHVNGKKWAHGKTIETLIASYYFGNIGTFVHGFFWLSPKLKNAKEKQIFGWLG